jgi:hypothetical protein
MSRAEAGNQAFQRHEGLKRVRHIVAVCHVDAALNATKAKALQSVGNVGVGLRDAFGMMPLGVGNNKIESDGEHQLVGSARIFVSA